MRILIERLTRYFGPVLAVDDVSLDIADGELLVLLGPSGCGKTTTMRSIVGLETPDRGRIVVGGHVVFDAERGINLPPHKRQMGMVFQSYAIWPHKTVFENVSFPLERQGKGRREIRDSVNRALELVGLSHVAERGASMLSGGQMQRVAVARSIVGEPRVLLLDEPLSNLDAKLRGHLRFELRDLQQRLGITTVYVTHDQSEALALADRIAVMRDGRIVQLDRPQSLYKNPRNIFVADFLGVSNIIPGRVVAVSGNGLTEVALDAGGARLMSASPAPVGAHVHVCMRPEHVHISAPGDKPRIAANGDAANAMRATVQVAGFLGSHTRYLVNTDNGLQLEALSAETEEVFKAGTPVLATVSAANAQLLQE